ncbi:MAG: SCO family protein, partial [Martelella sp.]
IEAISGDPEKVRAALDKFGIYYEKVPLDPDQPNGDYTMNHNASVFLLDDGGVLKGTIAYGENPDVAVKKLENLIN